MRVPVLNLAQLGMNKDLPPAEIPLNAFTNLRNMRIYNGMLAKAEGQSLLLNSPVRPYGLFPAAYGNQPFWIVPGLTEVHAFLGLTTADISNVGGHNSTVADLWNGCVFNDLPLINNGVDNPQVWDTPDLGTVLIDLPDWPANTKAKVVRAFKDFLLALNTTESSVTYPRRVRWSHGAPNGWPTSWDESDPALDAGVQDLKQGSDQLVDGVELGDDFVLYTEGQTWLMQLSSGGNIFSFRKIFDSSGLLSQGCATSFKSAAGPNMHFAVTQNDIVIHEGTRLQSIASESLRTWFFNEIDADSFFLTHVVPFKRNKEIWIFFPSRGNNLCDKILIWSWDKGTWSLRDAPMVRMANASFTSPVYATTDTWAVDEGWDAGPDEEWGGSARAAYSESILMASPENDEVFLVDEQYTFDGEPIISEAENEAVALAGAGQDGGAVSDPRYIKLFNEFWPYFMGEPGDTVTFSFGVKENREDATAYTVTRTFTIGTDRKVAIDLSGRYLSWKWSHNSANLLRMTRYDIDLERLGEF